MLVAKIILPRVIENSLKPAGRVSETFALKGVQRERFRTRLLLPREIVVQYQSNFRKYHRLNIPADSQKIHPK